MKTKKIIKTSRFNVKLRVANNLLKIFVLLFLLSTTWIIIGKIIESTLTKETTYKCQIEANYKKLSPPGLSLWSFLNESKSNSLIMNELYISEKKISIINLIHSDYFLEKLNKQLSTNQKNLKESYFIFYERDRSSIFILTSLQDRLISEQLNNLIKNNLQEIDILVYEEKKTSIIPFLLEPKYLGMYDNFTYKDFNHISKILNLTSIFTDIRIMDVDKSKEHLVNHLYNQFSVPNLFDISKNLKMIEMNGSINLNFNSKLDANCEQLQNDIDLYLFNKSIYVKVV